MKADCYALGVPRQQRQASTLLGRPAFVEERGFLTVCAEYSEPRERTGGSFTGVGEGTGMSDRSYMVAEFDRTAGLREAFLAGAGPGLPQVRADLQRAWERSRTARVHPDRRAVPVLLTGPALEEYRNSHEVYRSGQPALEAAGDLLVGTGCGIVLADGQGTVLHLAGDPAMGGPAESVGSLPGATWREDLVGNNAIGTVLVTREPVQFHFGEHWCSGWTDWACAAAPVLDPHSREPLAAVALVARRQVPGERFLAMATQLAGTLERQVQSHRQRRNEQLRTEAIKLSRWFPDHGALATDQSGTAVWSTGLSPQLLQEVSSALRQLPFSRLRGEQEMLLADRYPCLVIPIWLGGDCQGHVLIIGGEAARSPAQPASEPRSLPCIVAGSPDRRLLFTPEQILAVRTSGGQIRVITAAGEWPTPYDSMGEVSRRLPESAFFQVDRGCLVNLSQIKEIHPMFNRTVTLVLSDRKGTQIPVSRRRTADLRRRLQF